MKKIYNPKSLKQIPGEKFRKNEEELAEKMPNPYYFTDRALQVGFNINLDSHIINHANSETNIKPNFPELGVGTRYINKILKEVAAIYASLRNQYIFKNQTVFSPRFDEEDEDVQIIHEAEFCRNLNINHKLTESDIYDIDIKSPFEEQIQKQDLKSS